MASAVAGFMRTFGIDEPMGCYDDIEAADAFVLWGSNMAEMHPILWTRVDRPPAVARRMSASPCCRPSSTARSTSPTSAWCSSRRPISTSSTPSPTTSSRPAGSTRTSSPGTPPSSAARPTSATACAPSIRCRRRRRARPRPTTPPTSRFEEYAKFVSDYTLEKAAEMSGVPLNRLEALAELYADPEDQGHQLLDHGLQPAHPRRLVQQPRLQHPSADRKNLRARQQPVLADRPALGLRHRARGRHLLAPPARRHGGDQQGASRHRREDLEAAGRHHPRQARLSRRAAEPDAEGRHAQRLLGSGQQQPAGRRQRQRGDLSGLPQSGQFHRRLRRLSVGDRARRRPDPADRDVGGEGRRLRQCRAAHPVLAPAGDCAGRSRAPTSGS